MSEITRKELQEKGATDWELRRATPFAFERGRWRVDVLLANREHWSLKSKLDLWPVLLGATSPGATSPALPDTLPSFDVLTGKFVDEGGITPSSAQELKTLLESNAVYERTRRDNVRLDAELARAERDALAWRQETKRILAEDIISMAMRQLQNDVRRVFVNGREYSVLTAEIEKLAGDTATDTNSMRQRRIETWILDRLDEVFRGYSTWVSEELDTTIDEVLDERLGISV